MWKLLCACVVQMDEARKVCRSDILVLSKTLFPVICVCSTGWLLILCSRICKEIKSVDVYFFNVYVINCVFADGEVKVSFKFVALLNSSCKTFTFRRELTLPYCFFTGIHCNTHSYNRFEWLRLFYKPCVTDKKQCVLFSDSQEVRW